ncbi:MAG: hypothetical protein F6K22_10930 [Okeania sp. SIO2F4]|uniref:hypothetical protein n=1 Tax=Okeania sp. SIO2F4 TaxID=2607790 RepID=UPI0014292956|nr:hypothetical protein [Okeania sp. SIO2F4]NES03316.1 hypothetical protein [Okeania sp. SIO2F4]
MIIILQLWNNFDAFNFSSRLKNKDSSYASNIKDFLGNIQPRECQNYQEIC